MRFLPWPARGLPAPEIRGCPSPLRRRCQPWSDPSRSCGGRSNATGTARRALSLRFLCVDVAQVIGHLPDLVLRPQRAAADHAVERAFPLAPVQAQIHPLVRAVPLAALVDEDVLTRLILNKQLPLS